MIYKGSKAVMNSKRRQISKRYDKIFDKLETTYDADRNIIDTRFNKKEQEIIRDYLKKISVSASIENYEELIKAVESLDNKNKLAIINLMNDAKGKPIDINSELSIEKKKEKFAFLKEIASGVAAGIGTAAVINSIDETIISGPTNGFLLNNFGKNAIKSFVNDTPLKSIISDGMIESAIVAVGAVGTKAMTYIPLAGEELKDLFAIESLTVGGIAGGFLAFAKNGIKGIFGAMKQKVNQYKAHKEEKKKNDFDEKKYSSKNNTIFSDKQIVMLNMINRFMKEKDIIFDVSTIKTSSDLKNAIKVLPKEDKEELNKDIKKIESVLGKINQNNKEVAKETLSFMSSAFCTATTVMTINDIIDFVAEKVDTLTAKGKRVDHKEAFLKGNQETPEIENYVADKMEELKNVSGEVNSAVQLNETLPNETLPPEIER